MVGQDITQPKENMPTTQSKKLRVVSFYPEFSPSFWSFEYTVQKILKIGATMPPLGLATVLAMLPVELFELTPIIDLRFRPLRDEDIISADIVFVSAMIAQRDSLREVIECAKKHRKTVVVGGPYATSSPQAVLEMGADHIVGGEAEMTLAPFLEDLARGNARRVYQEKDVVSPAIALTPNHKPQMDQVTVIPRWDLVEVGMYSSLALQYSRGCPFDCEFCDITVMFGRSSRTKTPKQVIKELEAILATGFRGSIFIVDDNFIGNKNEVRKLLRELKAWQEKHGFPFSFFTEASLNLANPDMSEVLKLMVEAGFEEIFVGIESTDPDALRIADKVQNKGNQSEKVRIIQETGLEITAGFIIGLDGDKLGSGRTLANFIQASGIVMPMPGLLTVLPGTKLEKRLKAEERMLGVSGGNNTHHMTFNFKTLLPEKELVEEYVWLLETLFSARNYFERCLVLRERRGKVTHGQNRVNLQGFLAMLRVFRYYCVRLKLEPVKFMLKTLVSKPSEFPRAVTQAAKFIHFDRLTRATLRSYRT